MKKGFTLIELLVVIAIIGILASVVVASFATARHKEICKHGTHMERAEAKCEGFNEGKEIRN